MLKGLIKHNLFKTTVLLLLMTLFCFFLSLLRINRTGKITYIFLVWNLFLAFIPWLLSTVLIVFEMRSKMLQVVLMLTWVLFFPNAPYILTDIIHLGIDSSAPRWYNLILLLSYAITGLFYGFVSLRNIETVLSSYIGPRVINLMSVFLIYLSCFGIYLGRFLRWNSWDILNNPHFLITDVVNRVATPFRYPTTWSFTILFGTLLTFIYLGYKWFKSEGVSASRSS
jgi:uncharacterized membrane protein